MGQGFAYLTQSRFYSPALNAAIFDGSVRIYFSQFQEAAALKVYFRLQELFSKWNDGADKYKRGLKTLYIMLYPTADSFDLCFSQDGEREQLVAEAQLGEDILIGVRGGLTEEAFTELFKKMPTALAEIGVLPPTIPATFVPDVPLAR